MRAELFTFFFSNLFVRYFYIILTLNICAVLFVGRRRAYKNTEESEKIMNELCVVV